MRLVKMYKCTEIRFSQTICRAGLSYRNVRYWPSCHAQTIRLIRKILITFHVGGLGMILSDFEVAVMKSLRLVRSNTYTVNAKIETLIQNGRLPVGHRSSLQEDFLCVLS